MHNLNNQLIIYQDLDRLCKEEKNHIWVMQIRKRKGQFYQKIGEKQNYKLEIKMKLKK